MEFSEELQQWLILETYVIYPDEILFDAIMSDSGPCSSIENGRSNRKL
jgi:hypothetical protein